MRYRSGHKVEVHQKIVKDASRRVRAEGVNGTAVSAVMQGAGLTHGGFYKHFASKDDLLVESLALGPELARVDNRMKPRIVAELVNYKNRMVPFMPGRRTGDKERAFFAIFSTMIGAIEIARLLPEPAMREKVLGSTRDFLLRSFSKDGKPQ